MRLITAMPTLLRITLATVYCFLIACGQVEKQPTSEVIAINDRGVSKMGQFQYSDAHEDFTLVVEQAPNWQVGLVNLAIATLNRQNPDDELKTLEILQQVLESNPDNVRAQYTSGIVSLYLGRTDDAVAFLEQAIQLDPADAFTAYFLGQAHLQAGNYEQAQKWLLDAIELNNSIRSAYWAAATASRRLEDIDKATQLIDEYQAFEHNPLSVNAGFSYKQMGPKAEAQSITKNVVNRSPKPDGPLFDDPKSIRLDLATIQSVSSFDFTSDGVADLLVSDLESTKLISLAESRPSLLDSNLNIGRHMSSAWGDMNNDGTTELITCDIQGIRIHRFAENEFTTIKEIKSPQCDLLRVIDADHDGDLDVLVGGTFGLTILHNDSNGNYVRFEGEGSELLAMPIRQVLIEDIDRDRDADLILVGHGSKNVSLRNELTWRYEIDQGLSAFEHEEIVAIVAVDGDTDGRLELVAALESDELVLWDYQSEGWQSRTLNTTINTIRSLDVQDFDGDGLMDLLIVHSDGFKVLSFPNGQELASHTVSNVRVGFAVYTSPNEGPGVAIATTDEILHFASGPGRYPFLAVSPSGKTSADQMRSNASGIGTYVKLRADTRWSLASNYPQNSGPSQSLMPMMFGSGGALKADYIELLWSDGVTQSEIALDFGKRHDVEEIQRQLASCPVVFVWNGKKYEFLSDVLGVAALGYFAEPGVNSPVRPYERILLPDGMLKPRDGNYEVKIGEPMEEVLYLDSASLVYYDLPKGWHFVLDERLNVQSAMPTAEPVFYREEFFPSRVLSNVDPNAANALADIDRIAVDPGPVESRFLGLLASDHELILEFDNPLPETNAVLVADGWVEFPYSQTSFSVYQASSSFRAPTLEARDASGKWHILAAEFGFPAGMPRQMALPLPPLPAGTDALRLTSNLELYWDRIQVVQAEPFPLVATESLALKRAVVKAPGFAKRTTGEQRTPYYDYDDRSPHWDSKIAAGFYSTMGPVTPLVESTDSAVAIIGSGEEVHLEFAVPAAPRNGYSRYFVLDFRGWAKDMDLYTIQGDQVEPIPELPSLTANEKAARDDLHERFNLRYQSGMVAR